MFAEMEKLKKSKAEWLARKEAKSKDRNFKFVTVSSEPVEPLATPADLENFDYEKDLSYPGEYPYTRGVHYNMYRGRLWTMRQFAGFGTPEDTNRRFKYLLKNGQTGLSVAFDLPTLMGRDADDPLSIGEVGKCGVAVSSLKDMEIVFQNIPLDQVSTSMTINGPAAMVFAFYLAVAEKQGVPFEKLRGTLQADILKEYIAQKEWIYPPRPSMRIIVDMVEYCTKNVPQWNTISISGYHIREAGSGTPSASAAIISVKPVLPRHRNWRSPLRMDLPTWKHRWSGDWRWICLRGSVAGAGTGHRPVCAAVFFFLQLPQRFLRRDCQVPGSPANLGKENALQIRGEKSAKLAAALPHPNRRLIALRTQQIIAYETGVANTIDPLGGSYYVESLTNKIEKQAEEYFRKIEDLGGVIPAMKTWAA